MEPAFFCKTAAHTFKDFLDKVSLVIITFMDI